MLFSYEPFAHPVRAGARVTDVTTGGAAEVRDGRLMTEAWHTYVVDRG